MRHFSSALVLPVLLWYHEENFIILHDKKMIRGTIFVPLYI